MSKQVRCKSGLMGWQDKLQNVYSNFDSFEAYDMAYDLAKRLGFRSAAEAWKANPTIQGSTEPTDYCVVSKTP